MRAKWCRTGWMVVCFVMQAAWCGGATERIAVDATVAGKPVSLAIDTAAGAPLFEVANLDTIWIRVPVYVELLDTILTDSEARIVGLGGESSLEPRTARPVQAPPSADPILRRTCLPC